MNEHELRDVIQLLKTQLGKEIVEKNFAIAQLQTAKDTIEILQNEIDELKDATKENKK